MSDPDFKVVETKNTTHLPPTRLEQITEQHLLISQYSRHLRFLFSGSISSFSLAQYHSPPLQPVQGLTWSILLWLRKYGNIYFLKPGKREVRLTAPGFQVYLINLT